MKDNASRFLSPGQYRSLVRIGELYLPGTETMPSFSATGCIRHLDLLLGEIDPSDRKMLALVLSVLRFVPVLLLRYLLVAMDNHHRMVGVIAAPLRLLNLALKGTVMTLYYSGLEDDSSHEAPGVHQAMDFHLHCEPDTGE